MGYQQNGSNGSSSGLFVGALAVGIVMLIGLLVVGGGMVFFLQSRSLVSEHQMLVQRESAALATEEVAKQRDVLDVTRPVTVAPVTVAPVTVAPVTVAVAPVAVAPVAVAPRLLSKFHLFVNANGAVRFENQEVGLDEMVVRLTDGTGARTSRSWCS